MSEVSGFKDEGGGPQGPRGVQRTGFRRNLLFVVTLVTLSLVFAGAVPLTGILEVSPVLFATYWSIVFVLVAAVLGLAVYDLLRIRREHQLRVRELEKELARAAGEARELARKLRESGESAGGAEN